MNEARTKTGGISAFFFRFLGFDFFSDTELDSVSVCEELAIGNEHEELVPFVVVAIARHNERESFSD
jgi:hypothetical protein